MCTPSGHLRSDRQLGAGCRHQGGRVTLCFTPLPPPPLCPPRTGAATLLQKVWRGRAARKLAAALRALAVHARRVARVEALRRHLAAMRIQRCFRAHRRRRKARQAMSMAAPDGDAAQGTPASKLGGSGQQAAIGFNGRSAITPGHATAPAARSAPGNPAVSAPKRQPPSTQAMQRSAVIIQARWLCLLRPWNEDATPPCSAAPA